MIINSSRAAEFLLCKKKAFNDVHRGLRGPKTFSLIDGSAMHRGIAYGLAKKDWEGALKEAERGFEEDKAQIKALPEEEAFIFDNHLKLVKRMVECYKDSYQEEQFQVLQPECEFDVVLPGAYHNCIWMHHIETCGQGQINPYGFEEKWGVPNSEAILEGRIYSPHTTPAEDCECWQPHRLVGKTDAVVLWNRAIWLLEHKSSADNSEDWWTDFRLTIQPTIYIYGIWKHLGLKPNGVLVNRITKPSEGQVKNWNNKRKDHSQDKDVVDYITYGREAFLRTDEDLARVEQQMIDLCNEWEACIVSGKFSMSNIPLVCRQYNKLCTYHGMCTSHDSPADMSSLEKADSSYYVDVKLADLLKGVHDTSRAT